MFWFSGDHCNLSMLNFTFYDPKRNVVRLKQADVVVSDVSLRTSTLKRWYAILKA